MRNFEFGIKVKAYTKLGLQKKPRWNEGLYLGNNKVEFKNGSVLMFEDQYLKKIVRLEYIDCNWPAVVEFAKDNWEELKEITTKALGHFFPDCKYVFDENEHTVSCENFWISPVVFEAETFDAFVEQPSWGLSVEVTDNGSYWEPPSSDVVDLNNSFDTFGIVRSLIDNIQKQYNDAYWENLSYSRMAEEF